MTQGDGSRGRPRRERQLDQRPLSAKALRALIKTSGADAPRATEELTPLDIKRLAVHPRTPLPTEELSPLELARLVLAERVPLTTVELSPLDLVKLAVPTPLRLNAVSGEIHVPPPRRCPRTAEPTWQIPRGFSPIAAVRSLFGPRR